MKENGSGKEDGRNKEEERQMEEGWKSACRGEVDGKEKEVRR